MTTGTSRSTLYFHAKMSTFDTKQENKKIKSLQMKKSSSSKLQWKTPSEHTFEGFILAGSRSKGPASHGEEPMVAGV